MGSFAMRSGVCRWKILPLGFECSDRCRRVTSQGFDLENHALAPRIRLGGVFDVDGQQQRAGVARNEGEGAAGDEAGVENGELQTFVETLICSRFGDFSTIKDPSTVHRRGR